MEKRCSEIGEAESSERMVGTIASISTGQVSGNETENIGLIVEEVKGQHDYPFPFFPFQLTPIDSRAFKGVFGGRRWE
jgi:hypothetical protein